MNADPSTCSVCPRLCRHACPVAVGTGREASVPAAIAGVLVDNLRGHVPDALAAESATLCTDCGACRDACHLHRPLPEALREARARLLPHRELPPLPSVPAQAAIVVLEVSPGELARFATQASVVTCPHRLGLSAIEHPGFEQRVRSLRALLLGRTVRVQDGGLAQVLTRSGVPFEWCVTQVAQGVGSCVCQHGAAPPMACCGAGGPLSEHHPEDARRVARAFARRLPDGARLLDQRCAHHLASSGCHTSALFDVDLGDTP